MPFRHHRQARPDRLVGRHTAGHNQQRRLRHRTQSVLRPVGQNIGHRRLERRRYIGRRRLRQRARIGRQQLRNRRLQAGKTEIAPGAPQHGPRQRNPRRALRRQPFQRRPAGPPQPQHLGNLVERLAHGVIDRGAQPAVAANPLHGHKLAMSAGNQQQQIRKRRTARHQPRQARRQRMRLQMVHRHEAPAGGHRHAPGQAGANDQPADQPRPRGRRDGAKLRRRQPRLVQHLPDQSGKIPQMRPRRDFRHHAAKRHVLLLAQHRLAQHRAIGRQHGHRRLVARCFDAQNRPGNWPRRHSTESCHASAPGQARRAALDGPAS